MAFDYVKDVADSVYDFINGLLLENKVRYEDFEKDRSRFILDFINEYGNHEDITGIVNHAFCNTTEGAIECLKGNHLLLHQALTARFYPDMEKAFAQIKDPDICDAYIRAYVLPDAIKIALDEIEEEKIKDYFYTFDFEYGEPDSENTDRVHICAHTQQEAMDLFDYFWDDNELPADIEIKRITVVYNEEDAAEYGSKYGSPEKYERFQNVLESVRKELDETIELYVLEGSAADDTLVLRNFYYNPDSDVAGTIEEDVLYYNKNIKEFMEKLDKEGDFNFEGDNYYYPLNTADGYYAAFEFLTNVENTLQESQEKMLVLSSAMDNEISKKALLDFLHKHIDEPQKKKTEMLFDK